MQIDALNHTAVTPAETKPGLATQTVPVGADQVDISRLAQSPATTDEGRIEQLRVQVQSGSYDVSAENVAKALIDAHLNRE